MLQLFLLQSALVALQLLKNSCLESEDCDRVYKKLKAAICSGKMDEACEKRTEVGGRKAVGYFCYNCFMIFLITFILQWNDHTAPLMSFFDSKKILPAVTVGLSAKERLEELEKLDATYEHNTTNCIIDVV